MKLILSIYDYLQKHKIICFTSLFAIIVLLVSLVLRLDFKEDITDFLPVDEDYQESMKTYKEIVAADKIVLMFSLSDTSTIDQKKVTEGVERFGEILAEKDTAHWVAEYEPRVDAGQITDIFEYVYSHLPYYLSDTDYKRIAEKCKDKSFLKDRMDWVKEQIASPVSSLIEPMLVYDPLGLGEDIANMLKDFQPETKYKQFNGFIFTEDEKKCLVSIKSPFGGSETNQNSQLLSMLNAARAELNDDGVEVSFIGSPVIAVDNASQIKNDTIIAVVISVLLILALLLYTFRNLKSLLLIALTTGFGFLFALGFIALFRDSISLIVIGIASIIIGIAVNYPLHYVCHLKEHDYRNSLKDLVAPLLIGNITTVGAFMTLVPLEAIAIRDLGLFCALMLVGTIVFVLIFLPQINIVKTSVSIDDDNRSNTLLNKIYEKLTNSRLSFVIIVIFTFIFGYFSFYTQFDSNMNHINYMTNEQRVGMASLASMQGESDGTVVYVTSSAENQNDAVRGLEKLDIQKLNLSDNQDNVILKVKNPVSLLPSHETQQKHIALWQDFVSQFDVALFRQIALEEGFTYEAFDPFLQLIHQTDFPLIADEDNTALTNTIFNGYVGKNSVIAQLLVDNEYVGSIESQISNLNNDISKIRAFDLTSLNSRIADTLSDDFNYIGFACSAIVFLFLWISFGRIELAIIAFLPMAIGWLWILGLMQLFGISFNIVNIILATFIFGQGDDYTIFITEGLISDYKKGGKILFTYQKSILLSALIMLIGIGSLIISKHPAMHSLATVTIIGMLVVLVMSWLITPIAFNIFVKHDASLRRFLRK